MIIINTEKKEFVSCDFDSVFWHSLLFERWKDNKIKIADTQDITDITIGLYKNITLEAVKLFSNPLTRTQV